MMSKIIINPDSIDYALVNKAARIILEGGIIALPTETVYGLAALADKQCVVDRLYLLKKRSRNKPFSLALGSKDNAVINYLDVLPPFGYRLVEKFWPGPLTIIYYQRGLSEEKIGIRVPANLITEEILKKVEKAVLLPSANISGEKEPVAVSDIETVFEGDIDLIVDGGKCVYSKPSTVLDLTLTPFKILRQGAVSESDIAKIFTRKRVLFVCTGNTCRSPLAQLLLEKYLSHERAYFGDRYEIISRGISAVFGLSVSSSIASILKDNEDIDIRRFCSKKLDRQILLSSDLIFTMEEIQKNYILKLEPTIEGRVFNLKKFLPPELERDIPDPIGASRVAYENVYSLIKEAVLELKDWL